MATLEQDRFANKPGFYSIENIILSKPDYLIVDGSDEIGSLKFEHDRYHPALKVAFPPEHRIKIEPKLWSCAHQLTPQIIDMIKQGVQKMMVKPCPYGSLLPPLLPSSPFQSVLDLTK